MWSSVACLAGVALLAGVAGAPLGAASIPEIEEMVTEVSETEATTTVLDLVSFGTRYSGTSEGDAATLYLRDRLADLGLTATLDSFDWGGTPLVNVRADLPGWKLPEEIVLVLAHHDSTSDARLTDAPGADDDATGVAAVLETARVLTPRRFERTIRFLMTGGEEQGLLGSAHDVARAVAEGEQIVAVLNHDMIGYWPTGWNRDLDVSGNLDSQAVVDAYVQASADYVPGLPAHGRYDWGVCGDDQVSYAQSGFPAIIVMDCYEAHLGLGGETTPHYHRTTDTPGTIDFPRMTQVIRATAATTAVLAVPITRTLLRNDALRGPDDDPSRALRPGSPVGGDRTRLDPAAPETSGRYNPDDPLVIPGDGARIGIPLRGSYVFYETDRDERITLERRDADADATMDIVVRFGR